MSNLENMMSALGFRFEYRSGVKYLVHARDKAVNIIQKQEENIHELELLSGKSIEELIELFAAGWELTPPTYVGDLLSMMDLEE